MTRKRILIVDDEVAVLQSLRDLLRRDRHRWELLFAVGAQEALAEMRRGTVDVVVTDMRMPGMDGAELLSKVKEDYPSTVRLVLSGDADRETLEKTSSVAHQILSKPCDPEVLRAAIDGA